MNQWHFRFYVKSYNINVIIRFFGDFIDENHELQIYLRFKYFFCYKISMWLSHKTGDCLIFENLNKT